MEKLRIKKLKLEDEIKRTKEKASLYTMEEIISEEEYEVVSNETEIDTDDDIEEDIDFERNDHGMEKTEFSDSSDIPEELEQVEEDHVEDNVDIPEDIVGEEK